MKGTIRRSELELSVGWMRENPILAVDAILDFMSEHENVRFKGDGVNTLILIWSDNEDLKDRLIRELIEHEGAEGYSATTYNMIEQWVRS